MSTNIIVQFEKNTFAPPAAVKKVSERLPELAKKTEAFNRSNSQTTLNMMTLTMMTGQSPTRQVRQILAEIERRQMALAEAQLNYAKLIEKEIDENLTPEVYAAEKRLRSFSVIQMENKIAGSIKDLATLITSYDRLVEKHGIQNWTEEDFENEETKHHVRRGFELLYRNIIQSARPQEATIEYLQQFGVHIQLATQEVIGYITVVENLIQGGQRPSSCHLEDFLDEMAEKYKDCAKESAIRMFGVAELANSEFMNIWKK